LGKKRALLLYWKIEKMKNKISGFILIDKPSGMTSHDVVDYLRKITKIRKIGHAGTLDPIATGLLILGIGREATKKLSKFQKLDKEYVAKIRLGAISDTFDREGKILILKTIKIPKEKEIEKVLKGFEGELLQSPPPYSAKRIKGVRLYELARKGILVKTKPKKVKIYKIEMLKYEWPYLKIKVSCSSGTYIRSLANDIGQKLGCGGYVENLRRTKIGNFKVENAQKLENLNSKNWQKFLFNFLSNN
jgi:tRNA pseudouridine55 synthase